MENKPTNRALTIRQIKLTKAQRVLVAQPTPAEFVKTKPGRGGKAVQFVEGGYVVAQLNAIFGAANWEFEVLEQGQTDRCNEKNSEGEVWLRGKLSVVDHVNGYRIGKTQYGQHPVHKNVPIGDAFKAAGTDCLKKCASMYGIALDVYWQQMDATQAQQQPQTPNGGKKPTKAELMARARAAIKQVKNPDVLMEMAQRLEDGKLYNEQEKAELRQLINSQIDALTD